MKLIITGGAGYIGSKLVPYLAQQGHEITVLDDFYFGRNLPDLPNVVVRNIDLFDTTVTDYEGADQVIHLAGFSNDPMANFSPSENFKQNVASTSLVGYLAKKAGVKRVIFAGSCSVYGKNDNKLLSETDYPVSDMPYSVSKIQAENNLGYLHDENFEVVTLRQATVFGWAPRMRTDLVVNTMTKNAIMEGTIYVNDPKLCRPLIHVHDLCEVYSRLINASKCPQVMNVAMKNYTLEEIATEVRNALIDKLPALQVVYKNIHDPRSYYVDTTLMTNTIGSWEPVTIKQSVDEMLAHFPVWDKLAWSNSNWLNIEMYKQRMNKDQ